MPKKNEVVWLHILLSLLAIMKFIICCDCQGFERQSFLTSLAQFCRSTVNDEQCIAHKLLGEKFQVQ